MSTMNDLIEVVQNDSTKKNFYPTPDHVAAMLLEGVDFKYKAILEPSAGKGDLALFIAASQYREKHRFIWHDRKTGEAHIEDDKNPQSEYDWQEALNDVDIDCIEIDPVLQNVLESRGLRVVHDDFITFETQKRYDLIVMNPPFDAGAEHLLKAIDIMKYGGEIACILNAETLRNPYTIKRQELVKTLLNYGAEVRYIENAFSDAERKTDVEIALVNFTIPNVKYDSTIMDEMRRAPTYKTQPAPSGTEDMVQYNEIQEWVNRYNYEVACGIRLIEEYNSMLTSLRINLNGDSQPFALDLKVSGRNAGSASINGFIRTTRGKYWNMIFSQPVIMERYTTNILDELHASVSKLVDYEFSVYNILTLIVKMNSKVIMGVEETIVKLFDDWTSSYWHEDSPNRHYYNGWKTNDCFRVGKKVILPFYSAFSDWDNRFASYRVVSKFMDIEKTLDFLDAGRTVYPRKINEIMSEVERTQEAKNIDTKYFVATFYKKGTCHLVFKDMDLLEKFNMFASKRKGWLPPTYGKKHYADMTKEEQDVVDSFQGKEKYAEVMARADYFLDSGRNQFLLTGSVA